MVVGWLLLLLLLLSLMLLLLLLLLLPLSWPLFVVVFFVFACLRNSSPRCPTHSQIPLGDVLDVERRGKVVWIKCLHLGTVGFEASLETDAVIFYLAIDSLLDKRCGVEDSVKMGL